MNEPNPNPPMKPLISASDFLEVANQTMHERGKTYDNHESADKERSMGRTIAAFNSITGYDLTESDGWLIMLLLKQVRQRSSTGYHEDSALDSVAYAALLAESLQEEG